MKNILKVNLVLHLIFSDIRKIINIKPLHI